MHQSPHQPDNHEVCISRFPLDNPLLPHERLIPSLGRANHKIWSSQIHTRNCIVDKIQQSYQEDLRISPSSAN